MSTSRLITSSQTSIHQDLMKIVDKHWHSEFKKPYRPFSEEVFQAVNKIVSKDNRALILDSGCGNGRSTEKLAANFPEHLVIGVDKSASRLQKHLNELSIVQKDNLIIARTDLVDFYRQAAEANWKLDQHYLFYPNPWPKPEHLKRRWHGHPIFKSILSLGGKVELRTNWRVYAEEFASACSHTLQKPIEEKRLETEEIVSPFEQKYQKSGHSLFMVQFST